MFPTAVKNTHDESDWQVTGSLVHVAFWIGFFMFLMVVTITLGLWRICHEVVVMLKAWADPQPLPSGVNQPTSFSHTVAETATSSPPPPKMRLLSQIPMFDIINVPPTQLANKV